MERALKESLVASGSSGIAFEDANRYNSCLIETYRRTLTDIQKLSGSPLRILEIGAFTCVLSLSLRKLGHLVTASDMPFVLNDPGVKRLLGGEQIPSIPADLSKMPFPTGDAEFDLIVINEVIEHLNFNPIPLLKEFHRMLAKGGRVYCATPNLLSAKNRWLMLRGKGYINPVSDLEMNLNPDSGMSVGLHWREWTKGELAKLFGVAGFTLEDHRFGLVTSNQSGFPRKQVVGLMYHLCPSLLPNQVGIFRKI